MLAQFEWLLLLLSERAVERLRSAQRVAVLSTLKIISGQEFKHLLSASPRILHLDVGLYKITGLPLFLVIDAIASKRIKQIEKIHSARSDTGTPLVAARDI